MAQKVKEQKKEILLYSLLVGLVLLIGYISFGKGFDMTVYHALSGDSMLGVTLVKSIQEKGIFGIWYNGRIGAPDGANLLDYSVLGYNMVFIIWIISWFVKNTAVIFYTYVILTFAIDGVSMMMLLRKININRIVSFVISTLFACAPFHYYRFIGHSSLINYMYVSLSIYISLYILNVIREKKSTIFLMCIVLGLGYGYFFAFGLITIFVAILIKFVIAENKKRSFWDFQYIGTVLLTIFISNIPKLVYILKHGRNVQAGLRLWYEQEYYGLKIINLLMPVPYSRIKKFRDIANTYFGSAPNLITNENFTSVLGIVASCGLLILCGCFFVSFIGKKQGEKWKIIDFCVVETVSFIMVSSIGGFGEIFNWAVTSQVRCYNRSSIFIAGFSLIAVALFMNEIKSKRVLYLLSVVVLCVGLFDQVNVWAEHWQANMAIWQKEYEEYYKNVEQSLPENAMVYQLPYMEFPESGSINNLVDYEQFTGYLFTDSLKWSYGGVRGRNSTARNIFCDQGMSYKFIENVQNAGYSAISISLRGYEDDGEEIIDFYCTLGITPMVTNDGFIYTYDISNLDIATIAQEYQ